jgi:uncharacterized protein (TIGR03086 family)
MRATANGRPGGRAVRPGLLEPAIGYSLAVTKDITPGSLSHPTPCRGWDVRMLLRHASESVAALREGVDGGRIDLDPVPEEPPGDPVGVFRERAGQLLGAWAGTAGRPALIAVADRCLTLALMADTGALELAVHGWDLSWACGQHEPIPPALATGLLRTSALLVPRTGRYPLFGPPVTVPPTASPSDRLVAYLGRNPRPS